MGWLEQVERGELEPPKRTTRVNEWGEIEDSTPLERGRRDRPAGVPVVRPPKPRREG